MVQRDTWATRTGFLLAAIGAAVGLGNVWRFPFATGEGGGAAFLLVYLLFIAIVGFPAILAEFVVGRSTQRNPVGALREVGGNGWKYAGAIVVATGFLILSYYSVVAGWFMRYFLLGFTDSYAGHLSEYEEAAAGEDVTEAMVMFEELAVGLDSLVFHTLFMALTVGIVALGIRRGIEVAVKIMVPSLIILLLGLAVWAATLPEAGTAYSYYLNPEFDVIRTEWTEILPAAAGQAFYSIGLGMGILITYASYLGEDRNLAEDGAIIIGFDTAIAFLVGLVVFPVIISGGADPGQQAVGAIFFSLTDAFTQVTAGRWIGLIFFGTVAIAALSSAISVLEVTTSYLIDEWEIERWKAALGMGSGIYVLGLPVTYDLIFLDLLDLFADAILLVFGGLLVMLLVGWYTPQFAVQELEKGIGDLGSLGYIWIWALRVPVVIVLIVSLALGVMDYIDFLTVDFASWINENS